MDKVAVIQMISGPDVTENLSVAEQLIIQAVEGGAQLVILPENFALMGMEEDEKLRMTEAPGTGMIQNFLKQQAKLNRIWLVGGTIPLKSEVPDKSFASCLVFDSEGELRARYDKIHLFDVQVEDNKQVYQESKHILPGNKTVVVKTPVGVLGLAVCYDLRFPELFRALSHKGAELFAIPAAFTAVTGQAHWEVLLRARAIENLCFVLASGQGGEHPNQRQTYGHSMIVDPWGIVTHQLELGVGVLLGEVEREKQRMLRERFPVLLHRRLTA